MFLLPMTATTAAADGATEAQPPGGLFSSPWMYGLIILALVFFWWSSRKRKQQAAAEEEKKNALGPGTQVMTRGGMIGTIVAVDDDSITLETEPGGARTRWVKAAIGRVIEPEVVDPTDDADLQVPDDASQLIGPAADTDGKPVADEGADKPKDKKKLGDEPDGETPGYYKP